MSSVMNGLRKRGLISDKAAGKMSGKKWPKKVGAGTKAADDDGDDEDEVTSSTKAGKVFEEAERPTDKAVSKLSAKLKGGVDGGDSGGDSSADDNPPGKFRKRGSDKTFRGQPQDEEFRDD